MVVPRVAEHDVAGSAAGATRRSYQAGCVKWIVPKTASRTAITVSAEHEPPASSRVTRSGCVEHLPDERVELLERAVVHVGEVRTAHLLLVGDQAGRPLRRARACCGRRAPNSSGAVITTTASKRASRRRSRRGAGSRSRRPARRAPRASAPPRAGRAGGAAPSSQASSSWSAKTISAIRARSVVPKRSSSAARTSGSSAISRWTTSSADRVGTPRRANAAQRLALARADPAGDGDGERRRRAGI